MTGTATTAPPVAQTRTWLAEGTALFLQTADGLTDAELDRASALPGWTRRHVLAHVAANATAIERLVSWARTGEETRMYSSAAQRAEEIELGSRRPPTLLRAWVYDTADKLDRAFATLPAAAWQAQVVTAQGRTVPASELPWLRAREVAIHAVDLDAATGFDGLPAGFCAALIGEVTALRGTRGDGPALRLTATDAEAAWTVTGRGEPTEVRAATPRLAAWLTGRAVPDDLPELPRWL